MCSRLFVQGAANRVCWLLFTSLIVVCEPLTVQPQLMPPSQSVAPAFVTADSGPKPSVVEKRWSKWYRLGVGKAPSGYTVQKVDFWLTGDGKCGSSAECREITRTDDQVLWEFRLEGHEETGKTRQACSVAHIRVTYRSQ